MTRQQAMLAWVLGSAALMLLGAFGPWVKALGQSVSGTDGGNDGWFVVAAAVIGAALFYRFREAPAAGIWPLLGGALGALVTIYDRNNINDALDEGGAFAQAIAQIGWGLNLAIIASISFAVSGAVWWRKHNEIFPIEDATSVGSPAVPAQPSTAVSTAPPAEAPVVALTASPADASPGAPADAPVPEPPTAQETAPAAADGDHTDPQTGPEPPKAPETPAAPEPRA